MKVENKTIFMGDDTLKNRHSNTKAKAQSTKALNGVAFKENLDPIVQKKKKARQQAMKIIGDAFKNETKLDMEQEERRQRLKELEAEIGEYKEAIRNIENERADLRNLYEVPEGSDEENDLRLLEREVEKEMRFKGKVVVFSREELERLDEIHKKGLSEYQERSLEMKRSEKFYNDGAFDDEREFRIAKETLTQTKLERLKYHPMLDAREKADAVLDAASDEILGMLFEEGKEHVDEELEEKVEEVKEQKEEKEEFEERIEKAKERKEDERKLTEEILEGVSDLQANSADLSNAQDQVKEMLNNLKILEEDIKGAAVDEEV
jgi:hypothetical protein